MSRKRYKAVVFPSAETDLRETKDYLEKVLRASPVRLFTELLERIDEIEDNPLIHPLVKDPHLASRGYRTLRVGNFLLFYAVVGKEIQIHRFLYGKRDYLNIL